jgi:ABC-2 type transport system ATP-binding protein
MAAALAAFQRFEPVQSVTRVPGSDDLLYLTVDDAGEWLPEALNQLENNSTPSIVVESAEEFQLSYDDIFIKIMEQEEAAHG